MALLTTPNPSNQIIGLPAGGPIQVQYSKDVSIKGNDISLLYKGITLYNVDGLNIEDNTIHDTREDPISGGNLNNAVISGNVMYDLKPRVIPGEDLDHPDFIHLYPAQNLNLQDGPQENIVISDNIMLQRDGLGTMGIQLDDDDLGLGYKNILIEENVLYNSHHQGIRLEYVIESTIQNNTLIPAVGSDGVGIGVRAGSHDLVIAECHAPQCGGRHAGRDRHDPPGPGL